MHSSSAHSVPVDETPSTAASLLEGANAGDGVCWERIVRMYGPIIYTWARRKNRQSADAADIVQDVLASAARGLTGFDPRQPGSSFRGWLWTITKRRLADQARDWAGCPESASPSRLVDLADPQSPPLAMSVDDPPTDAAADRSAVIAVAIAGLQQRFSRDTIEAFRRTVIGSEDPADVAEALGVSRWTVYKARARVLQRLRTELEGLVDSPQ